jgi:uncharacterized protein YqhQ
MRAPDGSIVYERERLAPVYASRLAHVPLLRGLLILWDSLVLGTKFLMRSAEVQSEDSEDSDPQPALYASVGISLVLGVGLFFLLPTWLGTLAGGPSAGTLVQNLLEGLIRLLLVIGYVIAIGFMPDIQRVFAYHGAEHKTINAFEAGAEMTPDVISTFPLEHPRCGTAFLVTVVVLSVLLFSVLGAMPLGWKLFSRVLLLPVLAMVSYEFIRWTGLHEDSAVARALAWPNLAFQKLTTRPPTRDMIEVALSAFEALRREELTFDRGNEAG